MMMKGDEMKQRQEGRGPGDILLAPLVHFFFVSFSFSTKLITLP
jgi:hypothetical protein